MLARKIHNFLMQGGTSPLQPPKSYISFDRKGNENYAFMFPKNTLDFKKRSAPLRPPEIIYFCKFRPKRAGNYAYLPRKILDERILFFSM